MATGRATLKELIQDKLSVLRFSAIKTRNIESASLSWEVESLVTNEKGSEIPPLVSGPDGLPLTSGWNRAQLECLCRALIVGRVHARVIDQSDGETLGGAQPSKVSQVKEAQTRHRAPNKLRDRLVETIELGIGRPLVSRRATRATAMFPLTSDPTSPNLYRWQFSDQYPQFPDVKGGISRWSYLDIQACHEALLQNFLTAIAVDPNSSEEEAALYEASSDEEGSVYGGGVMAHIDEIAVEQSPFVTNHPPRIESSASSMHSSPVLTSPDSDPPSEDDNFLDAPCIKQEIDETIRSSENSRDMMRSFESLQTRMLEAVVGRKCQELKRTLKSLHISEISKLKLELETTKNRLQAEKTEKKSLLKELQEVTNELQAETRRQECRTMELSKAGKQLEMMNIWNQETLLRISNMESEAKLQQKSHSAELQRFREGIHRDNCAHQGTQPQLVELQRQIGSLQARLKTNDATLAEKVRLARIEGEREGRNKSTENLDATHRKHLDDIAKTRVESFGVEFVAGKQQALTDLPPGINGPRNAEDDVTRPESLLLAPSFNIQDFGENANSENQNVPVVESMLVIEVASPQEEPLPKEAIDGVQIPPAEATRVSGVASPPEDNFREETSDQIQRVLSIDSLPNESVKSKGLKANSQIGDHSHPPQTPGVVHRTLSAEIVPPKLFEEALSLWLNDDSCTKQLHSVSSLLPWVQRLGKSYGAKRKSPKVFGKRPTDAIRYFAHQAGMLGKHFSKPERLGEVKRFLAEVALRLLADWEIGQVQDLEDLLSLFGAVHGHYRNHAYIEHRDKGNKFLSSKYLLSFPDPESSLVAHTDELQIIPQKRVLENATPEGSPKRRMQPAMPSRMPTTNSNVIPGHGRRIAVEIYGTRTPGVPKIKEEDEEDPDWEGDMSENLHDALLPPTTRARSRKCVRFEKEHVVII